MLRVQAWLKDVDARMELIFAHPEQKLGEIEGQLAGSIKKPPATVDPAGFATENP